jgi:arylsulfatase
LKALLPVVGGVAGLWGRSIRVRLRRRPSLLLALVWLGGCGPGAPLADLPQRPDLNVIVVSFDALRADALGVYGYERRTSPHIDEFAEAAVVFENAYALAPTTTLSFAAAFSGRLPTSSFRGWKLGTQTVASLFAAGGRRTAAFVNNAHLSRWRGYDRGFQRYQVFTELDPDSDAAVVETALRWIDQQDGEPFFLWIHLIDPHSPWDWREESAHLYDPSYAGPSAREGGRAFAMHDSAELARWRTLYDGEVFAADALFRRLLDALQERALLERSVLAVTSDHGEEFMQHGRLQHGQLFEENLRVPLILHHPDLRSGRRDATRVSHLDLLPTLASLADLAELLAGTELDGRDLRSVAGDADPLLAVTSMTRGWQQASFRRGSRKLILECGRRVREGLRPPLQLYDLASDPGETTDLAGSEPQSAEALRDAPLAQLDMRGCQDLRSWGAVDEPFEHFDEKSLRQLEALGYIER